MRLLVSLILLVLQLGPALTQDQWREFRSDSDGFSILLPDNPTISSRRIGNTNATQTNYLIERGPITYLVSVIQKEKGMGEKNPDYAYYQNLMKSYTEGSNTALRSSRMTTLVGRPAMVGIFADKDELVHTVYLLAIGDSVYLLVYVGKEGAPDAPRMRDSFKLSNSTRLTKPK